MHTSIFIKRVTWPVKKEHIEKLIKTEMGMCGINRTSGGGGDNN